MILLTKCRMSDSLMHGGLSEHTETGHHCPSQYILHALCQVKQYHGSYRWILLFIWTFHFLSICSELYTNSPHSDGLICITWPFRLNSWVISCLARLHYNLSPVMEISQGAIQSRPCCLLSCQGFRGQRQNTGCCGSAAPENSSTHHITADSLTIDPQRKSHARRVCRGEI